MDGHKDLVASTPDGNHEIPAAQRFQAVMGKLAPKVRIAMGSKFSVKTRFGGLRCAHGVRSRYPGTASVLGERLDFSDV